MRSPKIELSSQACTSGKSYAIISDEMAVNIELQEGELASFGLKN